MNRWVAVAVLGGVFGAAAPPAARAADRPADQIVAEIRAIPVPEVGAANRGDRQAMRAAIAKRRTALERKATLIGTLAQQHPDAPELEQLLPERWQTLLASPKTAARAVAEIDRTIGAGKNEKLVREAAYLRVLTAARGADQEAEVERTMPLVDRYLQRYPGDDRGAILLGILASQTGDKDRREGLARRLEKDYPGTALAQSAAAGRQASDPIGKPFRFDFQDAISGRRVNSAGLKGKVVIVDFWATWCGPCVEELPKMKQLYAEYRGKGVEFVGISLDRTPEQGGYEKLIGFVEQNRVGWPQFYQGNGWNSEFSKACNIKSIPTVFAVDADGNLASTEARGNLDRLIPELLAKAKDRSAAQPKR